MTLRVVRSLILLLFGYFALTAESAYATCSGNTDDLLKEGNAAYSAGDLRKAEDSWALVMQCPHSDTNWPKAVFNLGLLKEERSGFRTAIQYFELVLASHPNDREAGGSLMETNQNYSHRSALQISACYEALRDYRNALRYARMAKTRYPYYSWCGTCSSAAATRLNKRIAWLTFQTSRVYIVTFVIAGAFFIIIRRKRSAG